MNKVKTTGRSKTKDVPRGRSQSEGKKIPKSQQQGPKGKKNAYMYFSQAVREEVRAQLLAKAKGDEDKVPGKAVTAEISKRYKALGTREMDTYQKMADEDRARFDKQTTDWEKKGYWIDDDGQKKFPTKKKLKSASKKKSKKNEKKVMADDSDEEDEKK